VNEIDPVLLEEALRQLQDSHKQPSLKLPC
jgi:hypothetical protein